MQRGRNWTREELLLAMNLYCTLPFGRLNHRNPDIVRLANALGRTPSSISMKLCNFASFDPSLQARGVKGLVGASKADREVWDEFQADWEALAAESEAIRQQKVGDTADAIAAAAPQPVRKRGITMPTSVPAGPDESECTVRVRNSQNFFRRSVLAAYGIRCCITGNPVPELLVASHILPWSDFPQHRANPRNGLCLSCTHDTAFDRGLITVDEDHRIVLSRYIRDFLPNDAVTNEFVVYEGRYIHLPDKFVPEQEFLERHREEVFRG